MPMSPHILWV